MDTSGSSDSYDEAQYNKRKTRPHQKKHRKLSDGRALVPGVSLPSISLEPLLLQAGLHPPSDDESLAFDDVMDGLLPQYLQARASQQEKEVEVSENGERLRPLTRFEAAAIIDGSVTPTLASPSPLETITLRKLKLGQERRRANIHERKISGLDMPVISLPPPRSALPTSSPVLDALQSISTTPFENSFLSRLQGTRAFRIQGLMAVDWETITPWMDLMNDVRDHYRLAHPDREPAIETIAPITYASLQPYHLPQVNDLLERAFWTGIDVSDSLDYWPERCTVVACYKKLVVGVAILSSPRETYITYLAVKAGWDKAQIARTMLYHLITLSPNKDITLHVSVNSSAMLLYNRFGFKAEEFVAGFYEDYLDPMSRASKNAFRLRLRQQ